MGDTYRVGLVIDDSLDRPDGVQQHVLTLGAWLASQGHEVHYLTSTTERTDLPHLHNLSRNLRLKFNGNRLGTPLPARRARVREVLAAADLDVVHVNMPYSPVLAGRVVAHATPRTAVVGTFHILPWNTATRAGTHLLGLVQRRQLRRFAASIAVSEPAREFAAAALGIDPAVIGNPVDVARFTAARSATAPPATSAAPTDRPAPATPGEVDEAAPVRVVFLGRLVERKGALELLRAVAHAHHLPAGDPDHLAPGSVEVVVAGTGPLLETLQELARSSGIEGCVTFPGFVSEDDKAALLASGDVVALPSTGGESFGISVVEALAAARGVVLAGDNPGYRTVMSGLEDQLVDATDTPAFAALLARYVHDADARRQAAERQLDQALRFDVATVGAQVLDVYARALAATRRPGGAR